MIKQKQRQRKKKIGRGLKRNSVDLPVDLADKDAHHYGNDKKRRRERRDRRRRPEIAREIKRDVSR